MGGHRSPGSSGNAAPLVLNWAPSKGDQSWGPVATEKKDVVIFSLLETLCGSESPRVPPPVETPHVQPEHSSGHAQRDGKVCPGTGPLLAGWEVHQR